MSPPTDPAKTECRYFVTKTKGTCTRKTQGRPVRTFPSIPVNPLRIVISVQLRYNFRLYPSASQHTALARAFGCARVVCNDALRARETARSERLPFPKTGDLSKLLITEAKNTPERAWLAEVSAVVLQQSLRDLDAAYRNFFDGLQGKRPRRGAPGTSRGRTPGRRCGSPRTPAGRSRRAGSCACRRSAT
ncbi:hypothetical protein GCM10010389_30580 [Streptomyces echinoruber]|uniref:Transposase putative helix-turn-helix domain-containing protein n=1 Tax=Streptomyces echinoruber TaxID=68898 RepID=A0A918R8A2_9ACTN|nr:hypothetical protein GCM10010389_30580 [Streptomyces echinoruber]